MLDVSCNFLINLFPSKLAVITKIGNFNINIYVMGRNTSISLGDHFEDFIDKKSINREV